MSYLLLSLLLLLSINAEASQIVYPTIWAVNDSVTNVKLNGNNTAISQVVNGGLDNTNANTTSGYRFYQTVAVLPSAGSQGAVYFLTSDNSLNFDTGSVFNKSVSVNSPTNGDILYYNGGWQKLAIGANNTLISSNGTIPSYGFTVGTGASNIVQLNGSSQLPAVSGALLTNITQNNLGSILDYGTSGSVSTTHVNTEFKVAYGNISVANKSSSAITNLPFTSSTSYKCTCNQVAGTLANMNGPCAVAYSSGSQVLIENASDSTFTESWQCIGT